MGEERFVATSGEEPQISIRGFIGGDFASTMEVIEQRRLHNAVRLLEATQSTVQHGLLKGYKLRPPFKWGLGDIAGQLLGLYEQEVCAVLQYVANRRRFLVDLGAANGFYGVGLVAADRFERSVCFEMDAEARDILADNARHFDVSDRVTVLGTAEAGFIEKIVSTGLPLADAVFLVDIEGAEFDILKPEVLARLSDTYLVIENHDFMHLHRTEASRRLIEQARRFFHVAEITAGPRDVRRIPLLADHWNDNDRWLICSESRAKLASWFVLTPVYEDPIDEAFVDRLLREYQQSFP